MLENIRTPNDIKALSANELESLAAELRDVIIRTVSENGGHLGSNLGLVETTLMLHKHFDIPNDALIFDVGHQCYAHKLLTGRYEAFHTLRKKDGISGFPNRFESDYDVLTTGHSGTSVSSALGIATANALAGNDHYAIAIVGDGSFTNGMIYEALNNCNRKNIRLIIILNDNEMSISGNVGSMADYLSKIRTSGRYYRFKRRFQRVFGKIPVLGDAIIRFFRHIKNGLKRAFYKQPFFEPLGVKYFGPVDGNDIERLGIVFDEVKKCDMCALVHIKTQKGKGYTFAEQTPESFHSVGKFDLVTGEPLSHVRDFSAAFGDYITAAAERNEKICALTAAMKDGTGLTNFASRFPTRFFDAGIAEEHEITFAAGLAVKGFIPICAVYATFAQRVFDQLIHDVSLQRLHIVLALDRAGFVPSDGETHQGIFDVPMISAIPNAVIYSPADFEELYTALDLAIAADGLCAVRYAKGTQAEYEKDVFTNLGDTSVYGSGNVDVTLITYGVETAEVMRAARMLEADGKTVRVIKLFRIFPFSDEVMQLLNEAAASSKLIYIAEEGSFAGGIGEKLAARLPTVSCRIRAIDSAYPRHAMVDELRREYGLDAASIAAEVLTNLN